MASILIVEDNELNRRLFSDLLKTQGHQITECDNGADALALVKSIHPDLVLMDIQMPEVSGITITEQIRKTPKIAHTRIVAVSAFAMKGDAERILQAGCDDYISKPISIPDFFKSITKNLEAVSQEPKTHSRKSSKVKKS